MRTDIKAELPVFADEIHKIAIRAAGSDPALNRALTELKQALGYIFVVHGINDTALKIWTDMTVVCIFGNKNIIENIRRLDNPQNKTTAKKARKKLVEAARLQNLPDDTYKLIESDDDKFMQFITKNLCSGDPDAAARTKLAKDLIDILPVEYIPHPDAFIARLVTKVLDEEDKFKTVKSQSSKYRIKTGRDIFKPEPPIVLSIQDKIDAAHQKLLENYLK